MTTENVETMEMPTPRTKQKRGFASMCPIKRAAIASLGGKAIPAEKRSFSQNRELASRAGRRGGSVPRKAV